MYKRSVKKEILIGLTAYFLLATAAFPADSRLTVGREDGFRSLESLQGVKIVTGPDKTTDLVLTDIRPAADMNTDLHLGFDEIPVRDSARRYEVRTEGDGIVVSPAYRMRGFGAGAFQFGSRLVLIPGRDALFYPGTAWGDFSIEFWMYPATLNEGERILWWRGTEEGRPEYQEVSCTVAGRSLVWRFEDFFKSPGGPAKTLELRGSTPLIPRRWRHHAVRFDSASGLIEYLLDGRPEAVIYAGRSGREDGKVMYPRLARGGPLVIGDGFTGFLDEFRISRSFIDNPDLSAYSASGGSAETLSFDLGYGGSLLKKIDAAYRTPSDSAAFFYFKIAENSADFRNTDWTPFVPGTPFSAAPRGRFVVLRMELFPDGNQAESPRISDLSLVYEKNSPPPAPSFLAAIPGDGKIQLRWSPVPDSNVLGYNIHYGTRPGVYDGNEAGPSPLKVGKVTSLALEGLTNGKLYYFVVSAYDGMSDYISADFSRETSARPSRLHRNEDEASR